MPTVPNPGAALRHMLDAAKSLSPGLTDQAIADELGVSHTTLIDWTYERKNPRQPSAMKIRKWMTGLIDELPVAFGRIETAGADDGVKPFSSAAKAS